MVSPVSVCFVTEIIMVKSIQVLIEVEDETSSQAGEVSKATEESAFGLKILSPEQLVPGRHQPRSHFDQKSLLSSVRVFWKTASGSLNRSS